jgi:diaminopimelate decarboxylase
MVGAISAQMGRPVKIVLRMNPDVDADTHEKITTGLADNKFGIPAEDIAFMYGYAAKLPGIQPVGIAMHIGSQILSARPYAQAFRKAAGMVRRLRELGHVVSVLDLGGGLGIGYHAEPGLSLGAAGVLLASVILEKWNGEKRFTVVDAGMNDLLRPAFYGAYHGILPVSAVDFQRNTSPTDVVGPVCESADCFAASRMLPELGSGTRIAILDTGAYGAVMSSTYNGRPRAAAVMIEGGNFHLITPRQKVEDLWLDEALPRLPE